MDETPLHQIRYEADIVADQCPRCGGMWLDKGELEQIEQTQEREYTDELARMPDLGGQAYAEALQRRAPSVTCPKCGLTMDRLEYGYCSQVLIDTCHQCGGVWLDPGEIQALEIFFERSRLEARNLRRAFWVGLRALFS